MASLELPLYVLNVLGLCNHNQVMVREGERLGRSRGGHGLGPTRRNTGRAGSGRGPARPGPYFYGSGPARGHPNTVRINNPRITITG